MINYDEWSRDRAIQFIEQNIELLDKLEIDDFYMKLENTSSIEFPGIVTDMLYEIEIYPEAYLKKMPKFFRANSRFSSYEIPGIFTKVSAYSFALAKGEKVVIPESVINIGTGAFKFSNIHEIILADSIKAIGAQAFLSSNFKHIKIPPMVKVLESETFYGCTDLILDLHINLSNIKPRCFSNTNNITINYPSSINDFKAICDLKSCFRSATYKIICTDGEIEA